MPLLRPALLLSAAALARLSLGFEAAEYELVAHLHHRNLERLEQTFWDVANPEHPSYLKHLSLEETAHLIGAADEDVAEVKEWLLSLGARPSSIRVSALRDSVAAALPLELGSGAGTAAARPRESLRSLSTGRPSSVSFVLRRDALSPEEEARLRRERPRPRLGEQADAGSDYTISNIKGAYGLPTELQATNDQTLQMIWGPGSFGYSSLQLRLHKAKQCPLLNMNKVKFDTANHGESGGDNYGEGNLDTKMISSFGLNVSTIVSNTNISASTEEGDGFGQALLDFATELASREVLPHVLSMSLGSLASASCDLLCAEAVKLGHSKEECNEYLQQQHQVCMFLSQDQTSRINVAFQVLGVRGVSVFGSSGDGGSHFSFSRFSGGALADTLNEISCRLQMPVFPTSSPYIVSVGGTMWSGDSSHPTTWSGFGGGSGSGFSWQFPMPEHQKKAVAVYLSSASGLPPTRSFNSSGRAYPDISAIAVEGTSQSCPIMAGIFSMVVDQRLNAGLPSLGFVAPRLWQIAQRFPGEAFEDVPDGNSKCSCDNGFPSAKGWDPNTGWGRPIWKGMVKHLASDTRKIKEELLVI